MTPSGTPSTTRKIKGCPEHPKYQGLRCPRTTCAQCFAFYEKTSKAKHRAAKREAKLVKEAASIDAVSQPPKKSAPKRVPKPKPAVPIGEVVSVRRLKSVSCIVCGQSSKLPLNIDPDTYLCGECTKHVPKNKNLVLAECPYDSSKLRVVQVHEHTWGDIIWFQCDECGRIVEICDNTSEMKFTVTQRPGAHEGCTFTTVLRSAKGDEDWAPKNPSKQAPKRKRKQVSE